MAKRAANFDDKEEVLLLSLVERYKDVIECKLTDNNSNRKKEAVWDTIEEEFNRFPRTESIGHRSKVTLKTKYTNLKKKFKGKIAKQNVSIPTTGEDSEDVIVVNATENAVLGLLGEKAIADPPPYDVDDDQVFVYTTETTTDEVTHDTDAPKENSDERLKNLETLSDVPRESSINTCKGVSSGLTSNSQKDDTRLTKKKQYHDKVSLWAAKKVALNELQREIFIEEKQARMKRLQEESARRLAREDKEVEARIKCAKERHDAEMELLKIRKQILLKELHSTD